MNNNEREEYRLAALAFGEITYRLENDIWLRNSSEKWRPLSRKSDAVDLMLDAKITLDPEHGASVILADGETFHTEPVNGNPMLAIFRCAVQKGRSIEQARIAKENAE